VKVRKKKREKAAQTEKAIINPCDEKENESKLYGGSGTTFFGGGKESDVLKEAKNRVIGLQ